MDIDDLFDSVFGNSASISVGSFLLCIATALVSGFVLALFSRKINKFSQSLVLTVAMMPAIVSIIILVVNGNIGTGIAVAGAFSLVRFRSAPGSAKEIGLIFVAMAVGLLIGAGFLAYALIFTVIIGIVNIAYDRTGFAHDPTDDRKVLKISVPEALDYSGAFDGILGRYTDSSRLTAVKSINMGSMFRLTYEVQLRQGVSEKGMLDEIRCRNGNLEVSLSEPERNTWEL